ncbi:MAG: hypothetical protein DRI95_02305 [Bacteroidetes bacterium]|nr:MAG: hypothetical protein DRI95_02305 [Bacteroidota bacterium]RLD83707.1 MAG: hypothetical protein DRJ07_06170 [Bacteroidota bacterium]
MKKILLVLLIFSISFWSCNDDVEQVDDENKLTENEKNVESTEVENKQKPELNIEFKAFLTQFKAVSLPYELNPEQEDVFGKISVENQIKYLAKAEDLEKADFEEMAEYTDFFFVSRPVQSKEFNAVVYARFEMGSTYYFLCTFDNDGKLIANIDFAAYELIGAGPQAGREYNTKAKIETDLKVMVITDEETLSYLIKENGSIDKL